MGDAGGWQVKATGLSETSRSFSARLMDCGDKHSMEDGVDAIGIEVTVWKL